MNADKTRSNFLFFILLGAVLLAFLIFKPFLILLFLAIIFAVVLKPLYQYFLRHMNNWPGVAALSTILLTIICLLIPISILGNSVVNEAQHLVLLLSTGDGETYVNDIISRGESILKQYVPNITSLPSTLTESVNSLAITALSWIVANLGTLFSSIAGLLFDFLVFLIALFYLLQDGEKLRDEVFRLSPLTDTDNKNILDRLQIAVISVVRGNLTFAFIQAIVASAGLAIFGVPSPVLFGMLAGLSAFVPGIGTSLVLIPAALFLFITSSVWSGIGMAIWTLCVGFIDNLLGPRLIGKGAKLHPLIVLLSVLGGTVFFGPAGIFLGPLSASLLFAIFSIYPTLPK